MLRADNVICGTSTTGTGTLTLAACPAPPGGIDFDVFARATGIGFGNSAALTVSYTIIEYTDNTFATAKSHEKGIGTLTLGGSSGIANCTLARTTLQTSATSLNSQPATQNITPGTGISIGTAANTLVFIGASADDLFAMPPYVETGFANLGIGPLGLATAQNGASVQIGVSGTDYYVPFFWPVTMLVKKIRASVQTAYTGGTTNLYAAIYSCGSNGRPQKLLIDFGVMGTGGTSLNTNNVNIASVAHATGFLLTPNGYFMRWLGTFTGGSGTPNLYGASAVLLPYFCGADGGTVAFGFGPMTTGTATGGSATAPDPANTTAYAVAIPGGSGTVPSFSMTPS